MATICSWKPNELSTLVRRHLTEGQCVALPSESTYEIVASADAAAQLKGFCTNQTRPALVIGDGPEIFDWLPHLGGSSLRLLAWLGPGAITLMADAGYRYGLFPRLPETARNLLLHEGRIAVRSPSHAIWSELPSAGLPLLSVPLAGATTAADVARLTGERVSLIVDDGPTQYGTLPSVVQVDGRRCSLAFEGALKREVFDDYTRCDIVFVCTGNTCRSPLAEVLCAQLLARHLGCGTLELIQHGFHVHSTGLAAMMGAEASPEAVQVAREDYNADLSLHRSKAATLDTFLYAAHIFTMTASHWYSLQSIPIRARLLSPQNEDIADPIGGELADYRACARQIHECLLQRLPELLES